MCAFREALSERREQVRPGLEPVLVEVPGGALARPEQKVALEQGVLDEQLAEIVDQPFLASVATSRKRSSSGEPCSKVTADPSAYPMVAPESSEPPRRRTNHQATAAAPASQK